MLKTRVCLVTTVKNPGPSFEAFLSYHLATGFERIYVFFDNPNDDAIKTAQALNGVTVIRCDESLRLQYKKVIWTERYESKINKYVEARQRFNAALGRDMALTEKFDWIFHIDCDELIYNDLNISVGDLLSQVPTEVEQVHCRNFEAVPESKDIENPFIDMTLFKVNQFELKPELFKNDIAFDQYFRKAGRQYFASHYQGKSGARVRADIYPDIHWFVKDTDIKDPLKERLSLNTITVKELALYHYPNGGFTQFLARCELWSKTKATDKAADPGLEWEAIEAYQSKNQKKLNEIYSKHILFTDKLGIKKLILSGFFQRNKKISQVISQLFKPDTLRKKTSDQK